MAATTIITDSEAKQIAGGWAPYGYPDHPVRVFADTGAINELALRAELRMFRGDARREGAVLDELDGLLAYVAHHGERGPVDGWEAI